MDDRLILHAEAGRKYDPAWDLGARFVLFPPLPREWMFAIIDGVLKIPSGGADPAALSAKEPDVPLLQESGDDDERA